MAQTSKIIDVQYHTTHKTLTLTTYKGEQLCVGSDVAEAWVRFVCNLFNVSVKKTHARFLEGTIITYEVDKNKNIINISNIEAIDKDNYLQSLADIYYIHDIVIGRKKDKEEVQRAFMAASKFSSYRDFVMENPFKYLNTKGGVRLDVFIALQALAEKAIFSHRFPIYVYKLNVILINPLKNTIVIGVKSRNALAKYFACPKIKLKSRETVSFDDLNNNPFDEFKHNPYVLRRKVDGVSFNTLDSIALHLQVPFNIRIVFNISNAILTIMEDRGHMYASVTDIYKSLKTATSEDIRTCSVDMILDVVKQSDEFFYVSDSEIYNIDVHKNQRDLCGAFSTFLKRTKLPLAQNVDVFIQEHEKENNFKLHENQKAAIKAFASGSTVLLITGGPGTGKSKIIKAIEDLAEQANLLVALCAPTGKAAKRLGAHATTIHRLIYAKSKFKDNYLPYNVFIIDEASMLDFSLMCSLIQNIDSNNSIIIFIGDTKQLPPVQYGRPFKDLLDLAAMNEKHTSLITHVHLTHTYRQGADSPIIDLANTIDQGKVPDPNLLNNKYVKFLLAETKDQIHSCVNAVCNTVKKYYGKENGMDRIQVLCCTNENGTLNNKNLNEVIHNVLYPEVPVAPFKSFASGEKTLVTKNNYVYFKATNDVDIDASSFNGDICIFQHLDDDWNPVLLSKREKDLVTVTVPKDSIDYGHSISIHKSQGSEYDVVILMLENVGHMLNRELLYTAVTRAKKHLCICGTQNLIEKCVNTCAPDRRSKLAFYISNPLSLNS